MDKICPVCNNQAPFRLRKQNTDYHQCTNCKLLFSDVLDNADKIGGDNEESRNKEQNHIRIARIDAMTKGSLKEDIHILDFGAGSGLLVADLRAAGYTNTLPYDAYNPEFSKLPEKNKFHVVTMIEVAEHIPAGFVEFDVIHRSLVPNGVLMVESSFIDVANEEDIPLEEFFYISPAHGHSTIHSHHSLDLLLALKGFVPIQHINRHVRLFRRK